MQGPESPQNDPLPVEVELYINPDGSVTFADLASDLAPLARTLNPEDELICSLSHKGDLPDG